MVEGVSTHFFNFLRGFLFTFACTQPKLLLKSCIINVNAPPAFSVISQSAFMFLLTNHGAWTTVRRVQMSRCAAAIWFTVLCKDSLNAPADEGSSYRGERTGTGDV